MLLSQNAQSDEKVILSRCTTVGVAYGPTITEAQTDRYRIECTVRQRLGQNKNEMKHIFDVIPHT